MSAGICDTRATTRPAELVSFADGALYWSKAHGRNRCWIYDPEVISELSAPERVERMESSQALLGLRALARAIDAKDPSTHQHSDRVAALAVKLAPGRRVAAGSRRAARRRRARPRRRQGRDPRRAPAPARAADPSERERLKEHAELGRPDHRRRARLRARVLDSDPS